VRKFFKMFRRPSVEEKYARLLEEAEHQLLDELVALDSAKARVQLQHDTIKRIKAWQKANCK